jgi:cytochrome P450
MQGTNTAPVELFDPDFVREPHPVLAQLRNEQPVREVLLPRGLKVWLVTRYEDVRAVLADPAVSKNVRVAHELFERHNTNQDARRLFSDALSAHMLNSDPPDHTRLRRLVGKAFTARRIDELRPRIEEITETLLDGMAGRDEVDLLNAFAFPLPITVICELLGVPQEDRDDFRTWSNTLLSGDRVPEEIGAASAAMAEYLTKLVADKRANPGEDMVTALVHAHDEGDRLDQNELVAMLFLLLVAGHETTVNLIGNGTLALLRNPDQLAALRADPSLVHGAIEEFLRYDGPVQLATFRFTTQPLTVGGTVIPEGEFVLVSLTSANRDPEKFADPDTLDVTRPSGGHVAFGHGIHYCLGAPLARLEGEIAIGRLLARYPELRLAAEPRELRWRVSTIIRGLETLPVAPGRPATG